MKVQLLAAASSLFLSFSAAAQIPFGVGIGLVNGVPGLAAVKWGPVLTVNTESGASRFRGVFEADYIQVNNADDCCGVPQQFIYDDRAILGLLGIRYYIGSEKLRLGLSAQAGAEGYREFTKGSAGGFTPAPTSWRALAVANVGAALILRVAHAVSMGVELREYTSLAGATSGVLQPQPAVLVSVRWR
jgi:hypothetical protein